MITDITKTAMTTRATAVPKMTNNYSRAYKKLGCNNEASTAISRLLSIGKDHFLRTLQIFVGFNENSHFLFGNVS